MMRMLIVAGIAMAMGACVADAGPSEPAPSAVTEPALDVSPAAALEADADAHPDVATVYECTTDGEWWGTRASCQANCAGKCFACGALCQN